MYTDNPFESNKTELLRFVSLVSDFLQTCDFEEEVQEMMSPLSTSMNRTLNEDLDQVMETEVFRTCMTQYEEYTQATLSGTHEPSLRIAVRE